VRSRSLQVTIRTTRLKQFCLTFARAGTQGLPGMLQKTAFIEDDPGQQEASLRRIAETRKLSGKLLY
jgi:hypothetical protein